MKNRMIKIGAVVPSLRVADITTNTDNIIELIRKHRDCGILVFPELSLSGYTCGDLFFQRILLEECRNGMEKIRELSEEITNTTIVVGAPVKADDGIYDCAVVIGQGQIKGIVPKINLRNHSGYSENSFFKSGKKVIGRTLRIGEEDVPFGIDILFRDEYHEVTFGAVVGSDLQLADDPGAHLALSGAEILVNLSASGESVGHRQALLDTIKTKSGLYHCGYVYTSAGMDESSTDMVFTGDTIGACAGKLLHAHAYPERPYCAEMVFDLDMIVHERDADDSFVSEDEGWYRPAEVTVSMLGQKEEVTAEELCGLMKDAGIQYNRFPFVPEKEEERAQRCEEILRIQANGLATRLRAIHMKNVVLGVSGGLDSTLALIVCHETRKLIPDLRIIAYTLPSQGNTTDTTYRNAVGLMEALNTDVREVAIKETVQKHLEDIGHGKDYQGEGDVTYENAQARMRTMILMDAANMENALVVGTGDLSELALGWCTYNGDHMSMYDVNAAVPKTLVQYICRDYALRHEGRLREVLLSIVDTPISPELVPNAQGVIAQKTEDHVGKYDLNDFFLYHMLRYGYSPEKLLAMAMNAYPELTKDHIKEALLRFVRRFFTQQFKRSCMPDGPKIGSISLSPRGGWHMPSDASAEVFIREIGRL